MPNPFASTTPRGSPRPMASVGVMLAGVLWLLAVRVNYRALLTRSLAMRTGRVDRQRLTPLIAALLVAAAGDSLMIVYQRFDVPDVLPFIAVAVIGLGSLLLAVGLANLTVDVVRLHFCVTNTRVTNITRQNVPHALRPGDQCRTEPNHIHRQIRKPHRK
ncbi:MAG: hypothetical protein AAFY58_08550, partial [Planctomycetota bacterium]